MWLKQLTHMSNLKGHMSNLKGHMSNLKGHERIIIYLTGDPHDHQRAHLSTVSSSYASMFKILCLYKIYPLD